MEGEKKQEEDNIYNEIIEKITNIPGLKSLYKSPELFLHNNSEYDENNFLIGLSLIKFSKTMIDFLQFAETKYFYETEGWNTNGLGLGINYFSATFDGNLALIAREINCPILFEKKFQMQEVYI